MNEMELLRELAEEEPLPEPADLDAARARLAAAIAADPAAARSAAVTEAAMSQPGPSAVSQSGPSAVSQPGPSAVSQSGPSADRPVEPLRPAAPAPVLAAARFMYGGAVSTAVLLIAAVPFANHPNGAVLGHRLTPTPLTITLVFLAGLALVGLWLWLARAATQGRNWARTLSTVLFGLASYELLSAIEAIGKHGVANAVFAALTWLSGLGAVWMLWRPASSAFFKSAREMRSRPPAQISGP